MSAEQSLFVLADSEKCTGCRACELACFAGHQCKKTQTVGTITTPVTPRLYLARTEERSMPVQCHHCEDAPCIKSCLTGAIVRKDGIVQIESRRCIGCRNCAISCPFGAVQVYSPAQLPETGAAGSVPKLVFKCDLCVGEKQPACVATCPNEALRLVDAASEIDSKRIAALGVMGASDPKPTAPAARQEGGK
ncbi:oxidoreductase [Spirochaetia bacterium]|nr:oxidoreductase [Spirochaetia bacterium]GHV22754.1 oxidoreductase [Spirochaetia bacterium]